MNIKDLRKELCDVFQALKAKEIDPKIASEMNNSAGKIINTVKVELEYFKLSGEKPSIDFIRNNYEK